MIMNKLKSILYTNLRYIKESRGFAFDLASEFAKNNNCSFSIIDVVNDFLKEYVD